MIRKRMGPPPLFLSPSYFTSLLPLVEQSRIEATCSLYLLSGTSLVKPNTRRAEVRRDETTETPYDWRYECGSLAAMQYCYCLLYWPGLIHVVTEVTQ